MPYGVVTSLPPARWSCLIGDGPQSGWSGCSGCPGTVGDEDRSDTSVWAITCLFTRAGYRRRGVSHAIAKAAVTFAHERGAAAVEANPTVSGASLPEELHVGSVDTFRVAGMAEVHRSGGLSCGSTSTDSSVTSDRSRFAAVLLAAALSGGGLVTGP